MSDLSIKPEWKKSLAGGFCNMTAPFALHPMDNQRAKEAVKLARQDGVTHDEFVAAAREHLERAQGWPFNMEKQLNRVRNFIKNKL